MRKCPVCKNENFKTLIAEGTYWKIKRLMLYIPAKAVASRLGISVSYMSDLESGGRPWTDKLRDHIETIYTEEEDRQKTHKGFREVAGV